MLPSKLFVAACLSFLPSLVWAQGGRVDSDANRDVEIQRLESQLRALSQQVENLRAGQKSNEGDIQELETRARKTESDVREATDSVEDLGRGIPASLILSGVLCALWAQATRRSAWLWFFLGILIAPIAWILVLWNGWGAGSPGVAR